MTVVVDIDDTLIDTRRRMQSVWYELLSHEVTLEEVETLNLQQIFMKYASQEQKAQVQEFQKRFWNVLLCLEDVGTRLFELHTPIPDAAGILQTWSKESSVVYLTGRTENTRSLTLEELNRFGFPIENTRLVMYHPEDYARPKGEDPSGPTLVDTRFKLISEICRNSNVVRVIDDYPGYFPIFKQAGIPDRIGFLRPKRYEPQDYLKRGATRVIESWRELQGDPPAT